MGLIRTVRQGTAGALLITAFALAAVLWLAYAVTLTNWLGALGAIIALVAAPGIVIFPILYWIVEDRFPVWYSLLWIAVAILYAVSATIADTAD